MRFAVVIEKAPNNYCAYLPNLPGCISVGDTLEEMRWMIQEAVEFHLEGMAEDGDPIPEPTTECEYLEVPSPGRSGASKYLVLYEKGPTSWGAEIPDLPGCVAAGDTLEEVKQLIRERMKLHLDRLREDGDPIPEPTTLCEYIEVAAPVTVPPRS
jgi:predicted RNase H-like HicB family nuclease